MHFAKLINTDAGRIMFSAILGLGLATMFRKTCRDKNCIKFAGPVLPDFEDKIYKFNGKCYKYNAEPMPCASHKRLLEMKKQ